MLQRLVFFSMEGYIDSDTSSESESEYESDQESIPESNSNTNNFFENLEPEFSKTIYNNNEYKNVLWNPEAQLQAQFNTTCLAQLYTDIKTYTILPDLTYPKLL